MGMTSIRRWREIQDQTGEREKTETDVKNEEMLEDMLDKAPVGGKKAPSDDSDASNSNETTEQDETDVDVKKKPKTKK